MNVWSPENYPYPNDKGQFDYLNIVHKNNLNNAKKEKAKKAKAKKAKAKKEKAKQRKLLKN